MAPAVRRRDARTLRDLMERVTRLARLGPHTTGVGCLYLRDLEQVDLAVLEDILRRSWATVTSGTFGQRARES
ncbi:hypothetical protein [Promicromonospora sp. MEB111]|uniref:hypothetical protein n=1 Tax=Promicromonospora sp. MEB111 TaxID=3040301 RepID=UPI0025501AF0|nr:hypothetical protein [Promicromonospora sp. MEB111]